MFAEDRLSVTERKHPAPHETYSKFHQKFHTGRNGVLASLSYSLLIKMFGGGAMEKVVGTMKFLTKRLKNWRDQSGQVAVIFSLSMIPIFTIIAMTIDFQRTTLVKSKMQHELDSAALRGARHMMAGKKPDEVRDIIKKEISTSLSADSNTHCMPANIEFSDKQRDIKITLRCSVETILSLSSGPENIMFDIQAESTWDVGLLDVAFMFDISGSMASNNRLNSLKNAANDALDVLLPEGNEELNEGVRIAMIAYDDMINAGDYFEEVTGLAKRRTYHVTDRYREQRVVRRKCRDREVCEWVNRTCISRNEIGECAEWVGGREVCEIQEVCWNVKEFYGPTKTRTVSRTIDSTCVWERPGMEAFTDTAPKDSAGGQPRVTRPVTDIYDANKPIYNASQINGNPHGYLAAEYAYISGDRPEHKDYYGKDGVVAPGCSNIQPLGLTRDRKKLEKYIRNLKTRGGTAGHQGIAWSWYLVSEKWNGIFTGDSEPFSFSEPSGIKAMILMSDGDFIDEEFTSELGTSDDQARKLCDAIKAQGQIRIYTVAFQAPSKGEEILKYCASSPAQAFTADDEDELREAYNAIAGSLSEVRIKR